MAFKFGRDFKSKARQIVDQFSANGTIDFPTGMEDQEHNEGSLWYHDEYKALTTHNDIAGVSLQIGHEEWVRVYNDTGSTIPNGTPVYVTGATGETPTVAPADATTEAKAYVLGIATHDISNSSDGVVTTRGLVSGIDTSALSAGGRIHVAADGSLQTAAPTFPYFPTDVGTCIVSDATNGYIYVTVQEHTLEQFRVTGNQHIDGNITISGDLNVLGTQTTTNENALAVGNNFVYLNSGDNIGASGTNFTGTGLDDATFVDYYEGTETQTYYVRIDGVGTGTGGVDTFQWSLDNFSTFEANTVDITTGDQPLVDHIKVRFNASTGHTLNDTWSGTASPVNVDTGWGSNRNTGNTGIGHSHLGVFYDVSEENFKFFDRYDPEFSGTINTSHATFHYADVQANNFIGGLTGNVTGNVNGNLTGDVTGNITAPSTSTFNGTVNLNSAVNFDGVNGSNFTINTDQNRTIFAFERNGSRRLSFSHETDQDTFDFDFTSGSQLTINGNRILTTADEGSGNGIDADTLDGVQGSNFLRSNVADTFTQLNFPGSSNNGRFVTSGSWGGYFQTDNGYIHFGPANSSYAHIYTDRGSFYFNKQLDVNGNRVWNAGNDGSGSGLDADRVDGLQASQFVRSDASDTLTGGTYTISSSTAQKIILAGATDPYIRWQEGTTNRFYIQWRAARDAPLFRNQQADNFEFMPDSTTGAVNLRLLGSDDDLWGSFYGNDSQHVGILDEGGSWAIRHQNNQGTYFYSDNSTTMFSMGVDLQPGQYGTVGTHGNGEGAYEGFSINGRYVFMSDDNETMGLYNDINNDWVVLYERSDYFDIYDPDAEASTMTRWDNGDILVYQPLEMQDNDQLRLGTGADFRMWHDGSHHYFRNYNHGNGNIYWQGEDNEGSNHALLYMYTNGSRSYLRFYENGGERMRTTSSGVTVYGNLTASSDERYKKNIEKIENALNKIKQIDGVTFDWDNDAFPEPDNEDGGAQSKPDFDKRSTGVIAQMVESVLPEAVSEDPQTGFKNVAYGNLVGLLIEGVKEIDDRLSKVEQRLDNIEDTS